MRRERRERIKMRDAFREYGEHIEHQLYYRNGNHYYVAKLEMVSLEERVSVAGSEIHMFFAIRDDQGRVFRITLDEVSCCFDCKGEALGHRKPDVKQIETYPL